MRIVLCLLTVAASMLAACGGSGAGVPSGASRAPTTTSGEGPAVTIATDDLEVGPAPFAFTLSESDAERVAGARLDLKFYFIDPRANLRKTYKAQVKPAEITFQEPYTLERPGAAEVVYQTGASGIYVADIAFDSVGDWVVDISGEAGGHKIELKDVPFVVSPGLAMPGLGDPAPRSENPVLRDVSGISEIDSSTVPDSQMHEMTISEAAQSGRPSVIVFASEGVCLTDICGPLKELADRLAREQGGRANFLHIEPYGPMPLKTAEPRPLPWVQDEWGLERSPVIFFLDSAGFVRDRHIGVASYDDLVSSLDLVAGP